MFRCLDGCEKKKNINERRCCVLIIVDNCDRRTIETARNCILIHLVYFIQARHEKENKRMKQTASLNEQS